MTDGTTKQLLAAIALGLWVHVVGDWLRPVAVSAQGEGAVLREIAEAVTRIERGVCINKKIC
jgi:hypothetical protein